MLHRRGKELAVAFVAEVPLHPKQIAGPYQWRDAVSVELGFPAAVFLAPNRGKALGLLDVLAVRTVFVQFALVPPAPLPHGPRWGHGE